MLNRWGILLLSTTEFRSSGDQRSRHYQACSSPSKEISKASHLRKGGCRDGERNQYHDDSCQLRKAVSYFLHLYFPPQKRFILQSQKDVVQRLCQQRRERCREARAPAQGECIKRVMPLTVKDEGGRKEYIDRRDGSLSYAALEFQRLGRVLKLDNPSVAGRACGGLHVSPFVGGAVDTTWAARSEAQAVAGFWLWCGARPLRLEL